MKCRERLESYLCQQQVSFDVQPHHLAYTAQEVAETEHIPGNLYDLRVLVGALPSFLPSGKIPITQERQQRSSPFCQ